MKTEPTGGLIGGEQVRGWQAMRCLFFGFCAIVSLAAGTALAQVEGNMIGRQSHNVGLPVLPAPGAVAIDGRLDDWDLSGQIWSFADVAVRDRFSARTAAMWDEEALYVSIDWRDPTPMFNQVSPAANPNDGWKGDSVQLRFFTPDQRATHLTCWYYTPEAKSVVSLSHDRDGGNAVAHMSEADETTVVKGIEQAFRMDDDGAGYVQELRIPWEVLFERKPDVTAGLTFKLGIEVLWGDATGYTWPMHRYADNLQPGQTKREFFWGATHIWGDATLTAEGGLTPRRYIVADARLQGTIPIRLDLPAAAARLTVVIEDEQGRRVRNLAGDFSPQDYQVERTGDRRQVELLWDGLDDLDRLVAPGVYRVRGLTHGGLGAEYEMAFYNPGTPPWRTTDGSGAWGADHGAPKSVAAAGDWMIIGWTFAEGGSGIIGIDPEGRKRWGEKRGATSLAADDEYVYAIAEGWHTSGTLIRLGKADGSHRPFALDGVERPFEVDLREVFGDALTLTGRKDTAAEQVVRTGGTDAATAPGDVRDMAVHGDRLLLAMANNVIAVLDKGSAALKQTITLPTPSAVAFDRDGRLFAVSDDKVFLVDMDGGSHTVIATPGLEQAGAIATDANRNVLVFDRGASSNIKAYSRDGKLVYTAGREGGRPRHGAFDPQAMMQVSAVAVDINNNIWVTEGWDNPRRVSVWNAADGSLVRDYVGNTGYAGTITYMHARNPDIAFVGPVQLLLDRENRTCSVTDILWVPDPVQGETFPLWPRSSNFFSNPIHLVSDVSGTEREYIFFNDGEIFNAVYMKRGDHWQPVAAITQIRHLPAPIRADLFADLPDNTGLIWNDLNRDGRMQRDECHVVPGGLPLERMMTDWGRRPGSDLAIFANSPGRGNIVCYRPAGFADDGAPIYSPDRLTVTSINDHGDLVAVSEENLLVNLSFRDFPNRTTGLVGIDLETEKTLWSLPNRWPSVHGSHRAPMPSPGQMLGPLKITGIAEVDGVGRLIGIRGNLGSEYFVTTDGLFVSAMFLDTRLPAPPLPNTEEALVGQPLEMFSLGGEPFNGWLGTHDDGVTRLLMSTAREAGLIARIRGLESIARFAGPVLTLDAETVALAAQANADRAAATVAQRAVYTVARVASTPALDGSDNGWQKVAVAVVESPASGFAGQAQIAWDNEFLYLRYVVNDPNPWRNEGRDFTRLFKTGDAVDLQLGVDPGADPDRRNPVAGDLRLVIGKYNGAPTAVLMQPVAPDASQEHRRVYTSPVMKRAFDKVAVINAARVNVKTNDRSYVVAAAIPLAEIGLSPTPGLTIRGDFGFISSDAEGQINIARTYWSNKATNLTSDKPQEAWLYPHQWGELTFE